MLCCLLAGLLAFAGVKGQGSHRAGAARLVGFGACCGVLAFEAAAAIASTAGTLRTNRPELLLAGAAVVTGLGLALSRRGGVPKGQRAWALFALSASGGSALTELADLHLLRLHTGPELVASIGLHGLAVVAGLAATALLYRGGPARTFAPSGPAGSGAAVPTRPVPGPGLARALVPGVRSGLRRGKRPRAVRPEPLPVGGTSTSATS
jgi:hypothetical protein